MRILAGMHVRSHDLHAPRQIAISLSALSWLPGSANHVQYGVTPSLVVERLCESARIC